MENLFIEIPADVVTHLRLPLRNLKQELKKELAVHRLPGDWRSEDADRRQRFH